MAAAALYRSSKTIFFLQHSHSALNAVEAPCAPLRSSPPAGLAERRRRKLREEARYRDK
jgi:hypothetical protein